jgi:predicted YcjX-like family ATPase
MPHDIHLGVTGLRRSGKTVFLTALIYQLEQLGSRHLDAFENQGIKLCFAKTCWSADGREFPYEKYRDGLRRNPPEWPLPTDAEYVRTLEFKWQSSKSPAGLWTRLRRRSGVIRLHLHDYPGEYLLDVEMARLNYRQWCQTALIRMSKQSAKAAESYFKEVATIVGIGGNGTATEQRLDALRKAYGRFLIEAKRLGMEMLQPGMTFVARDSDDPSTWGARALPFVPLPPGVLSTDTVITELARAYDEYRRLKVKPFVARLAKIDRQLVLVDILRVLRQGVDCFNDTQDCLAAVIGAYRYTSRTYQMATAFFPKPLRRWGGVQRVVFAATKADHALMSHRRNMEALLEDLVRRSEGTIGAPGQQLIKGHHYFASLRSTVDAVQKYQGQPQEVLLGKLSGKNDDEIWNPGVVPSEWPSPRADGNEPWPMDDDRFRFLDFQPVSLPLREGAAWLNLNLDRVLWSVLGDCLGPASHRMQTRK